jgi:hypothetical protein
MDINTTIETALTSVGAPAYWIKWKGDTAPPAAYITFRTVNRPDAFADDALDERVHFIYLDIFSETDPYTIAASVRSAMATAGFSEIEMLDVGQDTVRVTEQVDFHISFTFRYDEVV